MYRSYLSWLVVPVIAGAVFAQGRTWIVDQANGPGTHFTDLPPAIAAAADGDVLRMRAGTYTGATTTKGLTITGPSTAQIGATSSFQVAWLPVGRRFVLQGVTLSSTFFPAELRECRGLVMFDRVQVRNPNGTGLNITGCSQVSLQSVQALGGPGPMAPGTGLTVVQSKVLATDCEFRGGDGDAQLMSGPVPGVHCGNSVLILARCRATGGTQRSAAVPTPAAPAVYVNASTVTISGDSASVFTAGSSAQVGTPALQGNGTNLLLLDPFVTLRPTGNAPAIQITGTVTRQRLPALSATGAPIGGTVRTELYSPQGDSVVFMVGVPSLGLPIPVLAGELYFDPVMAITFPLGVQGPSEHLPFQFQLPNAPGLVAQAFTLQHLSGTTAVAQLSNPATIVVD